MFGGFLLFVGYTALLVPVLFSVDCHAKKRDYCGRPSFCGNIHNISDPFRLKGDPKNCGKKRYELTCENNRTVLHLFDGKYYVQEINYSNKTIRLVDVGIQKNNCSSRPLYSLSLKYLTRFTGNPVFYYNATGAVVFMNCDNPVKSPLYIDSAGHCMKKDSSSKGHSYVLVGAVHVSDVADLCRVEMVGMTSLSLPAKNVGNFSFLDVHNALAYGFELDWDSPGKRTKFQNWTCVFGLIPLLGGFMVFCFILRLRKITKKVNQIMVARFLKDYKALNPARYSYDDIKRITNKFGEKIGQGGYGTVYKGNLSNDIHVAVKILNTVTGNGDEFINEVGTIGRIHHINVVRLVGYCADGFRRALVYEFLPNHSLEKFISSDREKRSLGWEKLQDIAIGIAKGINYLHQGCDKQILHFDIKPHNILLDHKFNPKISDFGLAKLCSKEQSIVSMSAARGTVGYIAPEVFSRNFGNVSCKSDVYSFGMLLLEMVGVKNNPVTQNTSEVYFPDWIYKRLDREEELGIEIEEDRDANIAKKLTIVGLWCIQWHPIDRPSMKVVVQMLEGDGDTLTVPPSPFAPTNPVTPSGRIGGRPFDSELEVISESE